jgi:hypothetical protein
MRLQLDRRLQEKVERSGERCAPTDRRLDCKWYSVIWGSWQAQGSRFPLLWLGLFCMGRSSLDLKASRTPKPNRTSAVLTVPKFCSRPSLQFLSPPSVRYLVLSCELSIPLDLRCIANRQSHIQHPTWHPHHQSPAPRPLALPIYLISDTRLSRSVVLHSPSWYVV